MHFLFKKKQQPLIVQSHHTIKIVMMACETGGSGKTCLAHSIIGQPFQQSTQITHIGYFQKEFQKNKEVYKLSIWDTNSHEKYRSVLGLYLKPQIYICFIISVNPQYFSVNSFKSFLKHLISLNNDALIILCQSFSDLQQQVNEDLEIVKQIFKEQFKYFKVSAKTGQNIKQLRNFIVNYFHNLNENLHQKYNPKYSQNFAKCLEELSNSIEYKLLKKISQLQKENQIYKLKLIEHKQDPNQLIKNLQQRKSNNFKPNIKFINIQRQEKSPEIAQLKDNTHIQLQKVQLKKQKDQFQKLQNYHFYENSFIEKNNQKKIIQNLVYDTNRGSFLQDNQLSRKNYQLSEKDNKLSGKDNQFLEKNNEILVKQNNRSQIEIQKLDRDSFQDIIRQKYPHKLTQYEIKKVSQFLEDDYFSSRISESNSSQNSISISEIIQEAFDVDS